MFLNLNQNLFNVRTQKACKCIKEFFNYVTIEFELQNAN